MTIEECIKACEFHGAMCRCDETAKDFYQSVIT